MDVDVFEAIGKDGVSVVIEHVLDLIPCERQCVVVDAADAGESAGGQGPGSLLFDGDFSGLDAPHTPRAAYHDLVSLLCTSRDVRANVLNVLQRRRSALQNAFFWAIEMGHVGVAAVLTRSDVRPAPVSSVGADDTILGQVEADTVDPTAVNNFAIRRASRLGHIDCVHLLLQDPRVDPAVNNNFAIRFAVVNDHAAVVDLLLHDPRVDPAALNNHAISNAAQLGYAAVVTLLLHDPRVDPAAGDNDAIYWAAHNGHAAVVSLLLHDPQVDLLAGSVSVMFEAMWEWHFFTAAIVLKHSVTNLMKRI